MAGFVQPLQYIFDFKKWEQGELIVTKKLPYNDVLDSSDDDLENYIKDQTPLEIQPLSGRLIGGR